MHFTQKISLGFVLILLLIFVGCDQKRNNTTSNTGSHGSHDGHDHGPGGHDDHAPAGNKTDKTDKTPKTVAYPLETCIVSGEKLGSMGEPVVLTHEGQEIKLCCKACIKSFNSDPAKYIAKMKEASQKK